MGPNLHSNDPRPAGVLDVGNIGRHHANPAISKKRKWTSEENKIVMEWYLLSEPKIRGYRQRYAEFMAAKGYVLGIRTKIS